MKNFFRVYLCVCKTTCRWNDHVGKMIVGETFVGEMTLSVKYLSVKWLSAKRISVKWTGPFPNFWNKKIGVFLVRLKNKTTWWPTKVWFISYYKLLFVVTRKSNLIKNFQLNLQTQIIGQF